MTPLSDPKAKVALSSKRCIGHRGTPCVVSEGVQPVNNFPKALRNKDGYQNICKVCDSLRGKRRYQENREAVLDRTKVYGKANRHITRKATYDYYYRNRESSLLRSSKWAKANPDKTAAHTSQRRAKVKNATPPWLTEGHKKQIQDFFTQARDCSIVTGECYHVDHIIPLQNKNICGLHVPWNLQVLPSDLNMKKGNRYHG
jgi:hypothetical protein